MFEMTSTIYERCGRARVGEEVKKGSFSCYRMLIMGFIRYFRCNLSWQFIEYYSILNEECHLP